MSKIDYDQFIGVYDDMFPENLCDEYIDIFEKNSNFHEKRELFGSLKFKKDDTSCFLDIANKKKFYEFRDILLHKFWDLYSKKIDYFSNFPIIVPHAKIQKTNPGQGYHVWHTEWSTAPYSNRTAVFSIYLNDVVEGGETEFLYQHKRIIPKKGRVVIFPAFFPYLHRGNTPLSGTKYLLTGWFNISN